MAPVAAVTIALKRSAVVAAPQTGTVNPSQTSGNSSSDTPTPLRE